MFSGMPEPGSTTDSRLQAALSTGLSECLHLASQSLTILRARFDTEAISEMDDAQLRDHAERSCAQVGGLCDVVGVMKYLLELGTVAPQCISLDVATLIADVVDGVGRLLEEAGVQLACAVSNGCAAMHADRDRMRQALSEALQLARMVSDTTDTVSMEGSSCEGRVRLTLRNVRSTQDVLGPRSLISLAAVETSVCSQGGAVACSLNPFSICLELPIAHEV